VAKSELELLSDVYDSPGKQFLTAIDGADQDQRAAKACAVAAAADQVNAEAHRYFHSGADHVRMPLDQLTKRTEVPTGLRDRNRNGLRRRSDRGQRFTETA
jgi:hypothetical protein